MIKNILEFFRVISELRYIIPLLKYKWPNPDDNASLAHTFQDSVDKYGNQNFIYFEDQILTYSQTNEAANILQDKGAKILGDGKPRIGAHGKPVIFLHPKEFFGTLIELEQR